MNDIPKIVGLGETLWDVFPSGARLGGAPLNFSCSVAELVRSGVGDFTANALIVSAVGRDDLGRRAIEALHSHGVDTTSVQSGDRETGQVLVDLDSAGVASYRFTEDVAWDHLQWNDGLRQLSSDCDAVCFGTLGQRSEVSRSTIQKFVSATPPRSLRILDVNLRAPFYDDDVIRQSLNLATVLKLNDDELPRLAALCNFTGSPAEIMRQLADRFQLRCVALTRGADGAILMCGDSVSDLPGRQVDVADTVGAGDAFTAAMTLGLLAGHELDQINGRAIATAAYVCTQQGATTGFPADL
jgi:fructokinase